LIMRGWGGRRVKVGLFVLFVCFLPGHAGDEVTDGYAVCCIYHAPKGIDESSDESSSDDDDSDSGDDGAARPTRREGSGHGHEHGHGHGHDCEHSHGKGKGKGRARSPNAYEKMPKPKSGGAKEKG
jgi:protein phosphatase 1 regulatory subunit 11